MEFTGIYLGESANARLIGNDKGHKRYVAKSITNYFRKEPENSYGETRCFFRVEGWKERELAETFDEV